MITTRPRNAVFVAVLSFLALIAPALHAATFQVTTTADLGAGSLRQAITSANGSPGPHVISFLIPSAGVQTIAPLSALPSIIQQVQIDGYSQPMSSANSLAAGDNATLLIVLSGASMPFGSSGLTFASGSNGSEVRGLVLSGWGNAITFSSSSNSQIDGNFFGTNAAGTSAVANQSALFILSNSQTNTIGGPTAGERNVISGGTTSGITLGNTTASGNLIENNYIGLNAAGTAAIGNATGVSFNSALSCTIRDNVIAGATNAGIAIFNFSSSNIILGNLIGVGADGTTVLPNKYGILLSDGFSGGADDTTIGSQADPNLIANSTLAGIAIKAFNGKVSHHNAILFNSIHDNGGLGIDLGDDGVTANDVGDGDTSFNDLQNFPVITTAQFGTGSNVTIAGSLSSAPSSQYTVQFFENLACDASGNGEGRLYLGQATVNTDSSGVAVFNVTFPGQAIGSVAATATDASGNTSEFSACATVTAPAQPSISIQDAAIDEGNAGTSILSFIVNLSAGSATPVSVNFATADQTATAGSDYVTNSGTLNFTPGVTSLNVSVTVNGDNVPEADETLLVNLSNPAGGTVARAQAVGTIRNDDAAPLLTIAPVSLNEGDSGTTSFDFTVTLSPASAFPSTVSYFTSDGTALSGSDYQTSSGTLTFAPGQTTKTVSVLVNGDVTQEPNETFNVVLFNATNAAISSSTAIGTIQNDDAVPSISINDPSVVEGNSGTSNMTFVITLSNPSSITISVPFAVSNGTANAGSDYNTNSGSFTVLAGHTSANMTLGIIGDTTVEPDETILVNISAGAGYTLTKSLGTGTIVNDDGLAVPGMSISDVTVTEGNSGTVNANFNVTLTATSILTVTASYATANGTATAGSDYAAASGTVTFTPGQTSQQVSVVVNGDLTVEPNETFVVNLTNPVNATLLDAQGQGTINNDDLAATADLSITKTAAATVAANANLVYTIQVTNGGPAGATGVTVTDVIPSASTFVSAVPSQGSCSGTTTVTCSLGGLANAGTATITLTVHTPPVAATMVNSATVTAVESDPTPANNTSAPATTTVSPAVTGPTNDIPTLSETAMMVLGLMLAAIAVMRLRA